MRRLRRVCMMIYPTRLAVPHAGGAVFWVTSTMTILRRGRGQDNLSPCVHILLRSGTHNSSQACTVPWIRGQVMASSPKRCNTVQASKQAYLTATRRSEDGVGDASNMMPMADLAGLFRAGYCRCHSRFAIAAKPRSRTVQM